MPHKLMTLFARQLDTLNKNRRKGQQKVTVEHVHVAPGGQAIVGTVETGGSRAKSTPTAIDHRDDTAVNEIRPAEKAPRGKPRK